MNSNIFRIKYNDNLKNLIIKHLECKEPLSNQEIAYICGKFYNECPYIKNRYDTPSLEIYNNYPLEQNYRYNSQLSQYTIISFKDNVDLSIEKYLKINDLEKSSKSYKHYGYDTINNIFYTEKSFYFIYNLLVNDFKNKIIESNQNFINIIVVYHNEEDNSFFVSKYPTIKEIFKSGLITNGIVEEKFSINGIEVPKWLYCKKPEDLTIDDYLILNNADAKAEFIKKAGIDKLISLGIIIDTYENYADNEWWVKSEYKLIDMHKVLPKRKIIYQYNWSRRITYKPWSYAPFLYMKNQTTGVYHLEGVSPKCKNLYDALKMRYKGLNLPKFEIENIK